VGHQVDLIDLRRLKGWNHFRQVVDGMESQVFGLTMLSVDFNPGIKAASIIKELKPKASVIVGGAHASICPEELEPLEFIDHIVQGEGEIIVLELVDALQQGRQMPRLIRGERLENLDQAPLADRKLFQGLEEPFVPFLQPPFVTLIAGRGCRYNCNYCQPAERMIFGHSVRRRSVHSIIEELEYLREEYAFRSFMIHDDCLTEDHGWILEFCRNLRVHGFDQPFVCQSRADIICRNPEMMEVLKEAGLVLIIIGFESGSDRVLRFLRKGCTRAQNLEAARICHSLDIKICANYMLGLPTETKDEVLETYSMVKEIEPYLCSPAFYTPHPGSDLFEMGKEMGIHLITSHNGYRRSSYDAKIKGPDYRFLRKILYRSVALAEDMNTPAVRHPQRDRVGWLPSLWLRWRNVIRGKIMRLSPQLYHTLKRFKSIKI
jgi:radical SAM superfamily enzyme YgiQ (UPF0313 family)